MLAFQEEGQPGYLEKNYGTRLDIQLRQATLGGGGGGEHPLHCTNAAPFSKVHNSHTAKPAYHFKVYWEASSYRSEDSGMQLAYMYAKLGA